ncbi:hypothetical protein TMP248_350013 [Tenacibaculum maritimum]|uniref:hypothetical protein n=1 Tax=Tenacibaculum maritimum TaxID=107401 RepID=UPI0012E64ED1|nr:hypothetical protein [Tenacibaculum maritimum]CAA0179576.1 hypothetical protein FS0810_160002 [Tenacibaculum maritimum]CAA0225331.1 hypothetical protein TMP248_350013 [Tenacibaculum maritimum]
MKIELRISKREKIIVFLILILVLAYFFLLPAFPHFLFDKKTEKNNITIHYNDNFNENDLMKIISETTLKLKRSHFYNKDIKSEIFICNNKTLYVFLNPLNFKGFASNQVRYRNIFIANAYPEKNNSTTAFDKNRTEKLTNLLAHEINHGFSKNFNGKTLKDWKEEGYAEYIAYDKKVNLKSEYNDSLNKNYWYIKRKCIVYYLLELKKIEMNEFVKNNYDLKKLNAEIIKHMKE